VIFAVRYVGDRQSPGPSHGSTVVHRVDPIPRVLVIEILRTADGSGFVFPPILEIYTGIGSCHSILATPRLIQFVAPRVECGESNDVGKILSQILCGHVDVN
jgi:hypothetical protein